MIPRRDMPEFVLLFCPFFAVISLACTNLQRVSTSSSNHLLISYSVFEVFKSDKSLNR